MGPSSFAGILAQPANVSALRWKYEVVEFYGGVQRITRLASAMGYAAVAHDINYDPLYQEKTAKTTGRKSCMDINGNAGFVFLLDCLGSAKVMVLQSCMCGMHLHPEIF